MYRYPEAHSTPETPKSCTVSEHPDRAIGLGVCLKLDHIMYACKDLATGEAAIEELTGVKAEFGGAHPGAGTHNSLLSFGDEQYLEIIAPDPNQALVGNLGEELSSSGDGGRIHTWAAATDDLDHVAQLASEFGYRHRRIAMSRVRPDGAQLAWELLFIDAHPFGHCMPFFIDWQQSPHPSYDSPGGCRLESFTVSIDKLIETFRDFAVALQLEISIKMGPAAMMASINGSNGKVSLR